MIKSQTKLLTLTIMLLLAAILIVSFGCGGDSSGVVPEANVSQTDQTETLVTKDVEGVIYNISNSNKDTEEEDTFTVLPISMEGDEGFLAQVNEYVVENSSSKASDDDMQELLTAFNEEAENYQPLPNWNSAAGLYGSYADSESSTGLPVGADGSFNGSVLTSADEDVVPLDIIVPDGDVFEVETISSDLLNSSESSEINLKGCPANIITKPNRVIIFKVFSMPSANLYDAGLEFNLADSEVGVICGPIFIRCGGRKSSVAFGLLYVKKNVSTPFDTAIEVSTAGEQSLSIPVQVVKNTVQVTGTVYDDSPILKGWVKSIGPKSYCKIGADGTYTLPKVFMGTGRKFVAQWWTMENGKKVKHREVKFVDVMGDCVVDFGVVPTPTFPPPTDEYYEYISAKIIDQKFIWQKELGWEQGRQKTIDWLNQDLIDTPLTPEIAQAIEGAKLDEYDPYTIWFYFKNGLEITITDPSPAITSENKELYDKDPNIIIASLDDASTVKNTKVLMLGPKTYEDKLYMTKIFGDGNSIKRSFIRKYGNENVAISVLTNYTLSGPFPEPITPNQNNADYAQVRFVFPVMYYLDSDFESKSVARCEAIEGQLDTLPRPQDFVDMDLYGVVYIDTHGLSDGVMACLDYRKEGNLAKGDKDLYDWLDDPKNEGLWRYGYHTLSIFYENAGFGGIEDPICFRGIILEHEFFAESDDDFDGSLIFLNACYGWEFFNNTISGNRPFNNTKVFIAPSGEAVLTTNWKSAYRFFSYMLAMEPDSSPMSAGKAWETRNSELYSNKNKLHINNENDNTYLPGDIEVIVNKK